MPRQSPIRNAVAFGDTFSNAGVSTSGQQNARTCWNCVLLLYNVHVGAESGSVFVFYALHAGVACQTGRAGVWPPRMVVRRSSEFGELGSLELSIDDRQSSRIQIVNNIRITAILHRRTSAARRTARTGVCKRAGTVHRTKPGLVIPLRRT